MNTVRASVLVAAAMLAAAGPVAAQEAAAPDTSGWTCKFCTFESGESGWMEPALGAVAEDSTHFGDYLGRNERGWQPDLSAQWRSRNAETASGWDLRADRLGLDSRALSLGGGQQGRYRVSFDFQSIPHTRARETVTPFLGSDGLRLPAGWTPASTTGGMSDLDTNLHGTVLDQRRDRGALGVAFKPAEPVDLQFSYRRDKVDGARAVGASFLIQSAQLVQPMNQALDRMDASAAFHGAPGVLQLALASSRFTSEVDALAWQNPYSPVTSGATVGQLGAAPDNSALRISLAAASNPASPLQLSAQAALGRLTQDDRFLPATVNSSEAVSLPRGSLQGRVDTKLLTARAAYSPMQVVRVTADVLHDKRDNVSPTASYTQVVMDTFTGNVRQNQPYDFTRDRMRFSVEERSRLRIGAGIEQDRRERKLGTALDTREQTLWLRAGWRGPLGADLRLRAAHAVRDGASAAASASENTLMRAFQASDRRRDEIRADASVPLGSWGSAGANVMSVRNRYPDTRIGRTGQHELGYGGQLAFQASQEFSASVFASRSKQATAQAGSDNFSAPDWQADQDDVTTAAGVHLARHREGGLDFGADYTWSGYDGAVALDVGSVGMAFPTLVTHLQEARFFSALEVRPRLTVRVDLLYQRYEARDWALDGVAPDTVPNLLALGLGTESGEASAAILGVRYRFDGAQPAAD